MVPLEGGVVVVETVADEEVLVIVEAEVAELDEIVPLVKAELLEVVEGEGVDAELNVLLENRVEMVLVVA